MTRIHDAIAESIATDRIVHVRAGTPAEQAELRTAADQGTQTEDIYEAWGTDEDGLEWRVHLHLAHLAHLGAEAGR